MNTGLVTSFIIGGLLMLSILMMNLNVTRSATGLTMRQITQQNVKATSEILNHDISKIGFNSYKTISDPITVADSNKIVFKSNIDDAGSAETVEWFFDQSAPIASSENPGDFTLYRIVDGAKTNITAGITTFKLEYQDKNLDPISVPVTDQAKRNKIRHIKIELTAASREKLGDIGSGDGEYIESSWTKKFSPKNIK